MATYNKYNAKPVYYSPKDDSPYSIIAVTAAEWRKQGGLYFPSTLEYETFRAVRSFFSQHRISHKITTQYTIEILPKQGDIRAVTWCVDLKVDYKFDPLEPEPFTLFVEAKGFELDDYKLKMNLLKRFHPDIYSRVRVIRNARDSHRILVNAMDYLHK